MSWYGTRKASKLSSMDKSRILVFDVETTGLSPTLDEILQITLLDGNGYELFSSYIRPVRHKVWVKATRIHGITWDDVKNSPTFAKVRKEIQEIFNNALLVVGYNVGFDIGFVEAAGVVVSGTRFDVMTAFASFRAGVNHSVYRRCKLSECAEYFGYSFNPHNSSEDAHVTLRCFNALIEDERFTAYKLKEKKQLQKEAPPEKKKTRLTFAFKRGKWRSICIGLLLVVAGTGVLLSNAKIAVKDWSNVKSVLLLIRDNFTSNPQVMVSTIAVVVGGFMVITRLLRMVILFPMWIIVHVKRIIRCIKDLFD